MEWLVAPNGTYIRLTATQAMLVDFSAIAEDLRDVFAQLDETIAASRSLVADSRRWRRMRQSGLRLVRARDRSVVR